MKTTILNLLISWTDGFIQVASALPGSGVGQSTGAGSPFNSYTARVAIYVLLVGFLVAGLLIGAFLVLNLGLMSKRLEDRVGKRNPSDLGLLKAQVWPEVPYVQQKLPAEDVGYEEEEQTPKRAA